LCLKLVNPLIEYHSHVVYFDCVCIPEGTICPERSYKVSFLYACRNYRVDLKLRDRQDG